MAMSTIRVSENVIGSGGGGRIRGRRRRRLPLTDNALSEGNCSWVGDGEREPEVWDGELLPWGEKAGRRPSGASMLKSSVLLGPKRACRASFSSADFFRALQVPRKAMSVSRVENDSMVSTMLGNDLWSSQGVTSSSGRDSDCKENDSGVRCRGLEAELRCDDDARRTRLRMLLLRCMLRWVEGRAS